MKKLLRKYNLHLLIALAGFLNIFNIWNLGYGNTYYAAAIKSMMSSLSNFFFLSLDTTGFISVDKSPLSLWVDTLFAKVFGFTGIAILIPHAIEGMLVTFLVYKIVKRVAGTVPAFIASLVITLSPVNVAVYRNNTPDALLLVFVLLVIFSLLKYFDSSKLKYILAAAIFLGLGFNTKMLQAYLILPAVLAALVIFVQGNILQRLKVIAVFLLITVVISFSWITIVDLTPASMRPYVGSSENNSAWNLAFAYNGAERFAGESSVGGNPGFNIGEKGLTRLFTGEMGTQSGWFLASALLFSCYFLIKNAKKLIAKLCGKTAHFSSYHILTFISIVFLLTEFVFFSYASFFHSYYLNILALPIALLMGSLWHELYKSGFRSKILLLIVFASLPVQAYLLYQASYAVFMIPIILLDGLAALIIILGVDKKIYQVVAVIMLIVSLLITPLIWSAYTTFSGNTATAIFIGGPSVAGNISGNADGGRGGQFTPPAVAGFGGNQFTPPTGGGPGGQFTPPTGDGIGGQITAPTGGGAFNSQGVSSDLLTYLKANNNGEKYFVAVASSQSATGFILDADIGNVMTLGGFSGRDKAISLEAIKQKIAAGEIRFFYLNQGGNQMNGDGGFGQQTNDGTGGGMFNGNQDITNYVETTCKSVTSFSGLYDCKL